MTHARTRTEAGLVEPGTYRVIPKEYSAHAFLARGEAPEGMEAAASLIFMIMFIGGMFGVLSATGALDAGIERLIALTSGNVYLLAPVLMLAIAAKIGLDLAAFFEGLVDATR